jgi:predicted flavoprotein YhiN
MQTAGNMIFTEWGLNGPAVMDLSHLIPESPGDSYFLSLDLLHFIENAFFSLLALKRNAEIPVTLFLSAFFPPKVAQCYTRLAGFDEKTLMAELNDNSIQRMLSQLKDTRLKAKGVRGYKYCQASTGGVPVSEVKPTTLESRFHPGLFLTGETLDVVGRCGGFNLHFAFASGILAGRAAGNISD